jgi:AraC-like DNA-binding protein/quercetin dioxygenase-like cupin family protein
MTNAFSVMEQHLEAPREPNPIGKLVLSRLKPGSSMLGAPAPSLKLVLDGEEIYEVDGRSVRVRPGQFLYLDGGAHCIGINRTETTGICLMLPPVPLTADAPRAQGHDPVFGRALVLSTRTSAMGRTLEEYGRKIACNPELGPHVAGGLLRKVEQAVADPLAESRAAMERLKVAKMSTRRSLFERLERARGFLHHNDDRNVTLAELASVAGLSQFHLARYFKLAFGQAPIAYHRALRLARAAELLAGGGVSLSQAAEVAGYSDQVALSHAFRRQYGASPRHWVTERRAS